MNWYQRHCLLFTLRIKLHLLVCCAVLLYDSPLFWARLCEKRTSLYSITTWRLTTHAVVSNDTCRWSSDIIETERLLNMGVTVHIIRKSLLGGFHGVALGCTTEKWQKELNIVCFWMLTVLHFMVKAISHWHCGLKTYSPRRWTPGCRRCPSLRSPS